MGILGSIYSIIQLILTAFGLWEDFLSWSDKQRLAESEKRNQTRNDAVDKQKGATNEDEFDRAQDTITNNLPH